VSALRVAAVQHDILWEDGPANLARLQPMVAKAAGDGARLVLLSEMFPTGFSMATERVAEPPDGPSVEFLRQQAGDFDIWVGGSISVAPDSGGKPVNQFVLAGPGGEVHRYAKIHPFSYGGETDFYDAGRETLTVDMDGVRTTPFVCYDLRFADLFWDAAAATDLYVVVANWPASRRHHWRTLLMARAIENQAWVVGVNRVGNGGGLGYAGDTQVIDPMGTIAAEADREAQGEEIVVADIDTETVVRTRTRFPFLEDR